MSIQKQLQNVALLTKGFRFLLRFIKDMYKSENNRKIDLFITMLNTLFKVGICCLRMCLYSIA